MGNKKTNIKIKHHKYNLYNKKKSKFRQILTIAVTVAAACVLGVVGYGIGKPIVNYFQNKEQYTSNGDSSSYVSGGAVSTADSSTESSSDNVSSAESSAVSSSVGDTVSSIVPAEETKEKMYFLPENAAASSDSLKSALAAAKSLDCTVAVITLKDSEGLFYYKSNLEVIKDADIINGSLTAQQISSVISDVGFTPAARISTLKDKSSMRYIDGGYNIVGGGGWIDNYADKGGKPWLSPFQNETVNYIGSITQELSAAGFKHIICAETMYPTFHGIDISTYLSDLPLTDNAQRTAALWNVVDSAKSGAEQAGAKLWIEMDGTALLSAEKQSTDAELAQDSAKLGNSNLVIRYVPDNANSDAYTNAKTFVSSLKSVTGSAEITVSIDTLSGSALESASKAFNEAGITVLVTNK